MSAGHDPGGKITIFTLMGPIGAILGGFLGAGIGSQFGEIWQIVLAVALGIVGLGVGNILSQVLTIRGFQSILTELQSEDTETLRKKLQDQYFIGHFVTIELLRRGEPKAGIVNTVLNMMLSANADIRLFAWRNLNMNFPETAALLGNFNPSRSPAEYKDEIENARVLSMSVPGPSESETKSNES